ncbi:histidine phosphatase family protein [Carnimonas bestiolae]|uniref:histidine phosphatase family protein n=1 Tax=Carnimonas bestiolae TaxID=3402172 RepID=UPI003EDCAD22
MGNSRIIIDCLRHGACEGPSSLRGRSDVALNESGVAQMERAFEYLQRPQRLITSPLRRCRDSAAQFAAGWQLSLEEDPRVAEMNFGDWDGVALATLHQRFPEQLARFWQDPYANPPPNAESVDSFSARCRDAWRGLIDFAHPHTLVVTHGGVIKRWIADVLGIDALSSAFLAALGVNYADLVRFEVNRDSEGQHWTRLVYLGPPGGAP